MEKSKRIETGITGLTIRVNLNDAIAIAIFLNQIEEFKKQVEEYNRWAQFPDHVDPETGEFIPLPKDPLTHFNPMEFLDKAKNILRQLTFVNISESNVFDEDWMKSDDHEKARKACK